MVEQINCEHLMKKIWDDGVLLDRATILGICAAVRTDKNMMFAGFPGTAKTRTAAALAKALHGGDLDNNFNNKYFRITASPGITRQEFFGDWNYQKQFLEVQAMCSGTSCPAEHVDHVYRRENFVSGPALKAIENDGVLFIDEGNRGGEDFQNLLLEVSEEKQVTVPMLGTVRSNTKGRPLVIVTYNEHDIGTEPFSDAFKRRFMRIKFKNLSLPQIDQVLAKKHDKAFAADVDKAVSVYTKKGD